MQHIPSDKLINFVTFYLSNFRPGSCEKMVLFVKCTSLSFFKYHKILLTLSKTFIYVNAKTQEDLVVVCLVLVFFSFFFFFTFSFLFFARNWYDLFG